MSSQTSLTKIPTIDLRSLALWRIATALLLIVDLIWRSFDLHTFYTDSGILPRSTLASISLSHPNLSLHALSGSAGWQISLFALAFACAVGLLVGWRTRLMTLLCCLLLLSLQARNPLVLYRGDVVLRLFLFWSLFLPTGDRWSLDARRTKKSPYASSTSPTSNSSATSSTPSTDAVSSASSSPSSSTSSSPTDPPSTGVLSIGSLAFLLQLITIYWVSILHKNGDAWWSEGSAVYYTLQLDDFTTQLGAWLGQQYALSAPLTWMTLTLELLAPLLLLSPFKNARFRLLAIALAASLHLGFFLTMRLDLFPWVMLASWLPWLPTTIWSRDPKETPTTKQRESDEPAFEEKTHPQASGLPRGTNRSTWTHHPVQALVLLLLIATLSWNAYELRGGPKPSWLSAWMKPIGLVQRWSMFSPHPARDDGWLVLKADYAGSAQVDLLRPEKPPSQGKPEDMDRFHLRWRALFMALVRDDQGEHLYDFLSWACRSAPDRPETITLVFEEERTMPPGSPPERSSLELGELRCEEALQQENQ